MLTVVAGISLAACSTIEPHPLVEKDLIAQARADQEQARAGVDPVTGEITLEEAMARALKYNLGGCTNWDTPLPPSASAAASRPWASPSWCCGRWPTPTPTKPGGSTTTSSA